MLLLPQETVTPWGAKTLQTLSNSSGSFLEVMLCQQRLT
jgi:hypothetical protein